MIGNWYVIKIPQIIAAFLQNYFINNFILLIIHQYFCPNPAIAGSKSEPWVANIGNDWELVCNKNSPNNRRIFAKLFYK
jgi:hypothetical protein